jgi:hypothetical protein
MAELRAQHSIYGVRYCVTLKRRSRKDLGFGFTQNIEKWDYKLKIDSFYRA